MNTTIKIVNLLLYKVVWLVCVMGAARGYPWAGALSCGVCVALHLAFAEDRWREVRLITIASVIGYIGDSILVLCGFIAFTEPAKFGWPSALWMVGLWAGFATTLNTLAWLNERYIGAILFGMIGGPLAYWAGVSLHALQIRWAFAPLAAVSIEWSIAMPLLLWLNRSPATPPATKESGPINTATEGAA